jgi:hypothetical protein
MVFVRVSSPMRYFAVLCAVLPAWLMVGCGGLDPAAVGTLDGVGDLPGPLSADNELGSRSDLARAEILAARSELGMADLIEGPRVMVIGDSIFASMSRRYGGEICTALTPLGFDVEVNAEVGRFVDFGERVLQRRLQPRSGLDWDAVVLSLGSNFGGDLSAYRTRLIRILDKLEPRPVLLFTVSEFRPDRIKLNDVIVEMVQMYSNVFVVDWSAIVAREPSLLQRDRLHLTESGRNRLVSEMARALGSYSTTRQGRCLPTEFSDDSAISGVEDATIVTPPRNSSGTVTGTTVEALPPVASDPEDDSEEDLSENGPGEDQADTEATTTTSTPSTSTSSTSTPSTSTSSTSTSSTSTPATTAP